MTERTLVTKLIYSKTTGHIDLIGRGHQYKDFTLFDASDLQEVGIDINSLETGVEIPCRFWAIWEASDKRNKAGNPYKDIVALEPISKPATTTSTDTSSLLDELRGVNVQLEALIQLFTPLVSRLLATEPPAAPPAPAADPYPAGNPVADAEPQVDRETGEIAYQEPISDEPFPTIADAINYGVAAGAFPTIAEATYIYQLLKAERKPKSARKMARMWREEVASRLA